MKLKATYRLLLLLSLTWSSFALGQAPSGSIDMLDQFYDACSRVNGNASSYFLPSGNCRIIQYDENGSPQALTLKPKAFEQQANTVASLFKVRQEPVVIYSRYYGHVATAYLSLYTQLIDEKNADTINVRNIHIVQMTLRDDWKIIDMIVQPEVRSYPFSESLWPGELVGGIQMGLSTSNANRAKASADTTAYDPNQVHNQSELDVEPAYPGYPELYKSLLDSFGASDEAVENGSPFTVIIAEDGGAILGYVGDLSGAEIEKAKSFVNSMLIWYPGIKDEASVKSKLVFYFK